ncbi:MAG: LysR family transcriptional regulator [Chloroflexota bacterium]
MSITLTQLRAFVAVAQTESVHRAAQRLFLTQPSVSAAIAALARELGAPLLERSGRGIRLTEAGRAFAPYASEVLGLLEQGREAVKETARPELSRVRVAAVTTAGEYLMPALIRAYRERERDTEILLEIGNRKEVLEKVGSFHADIGIGGRPPSEHIVGRPFLPNDLIVVGAEVPKDLTQATWLLREEGSGTRAATESYLVEHGIVPREVLTLGSNGAVKQALTLGLGITLISEHAVLQELRRGELVRIPAPGTPLRRSWYALYARRVKLRPSARRFLAFLHSQEGKRAIEEAVGVA